MQDGRTGGATWLLDWVSNAQIIPMHAGGDRAGGRSLPPFVIIAVANGGEERSLEYDTMSDRYARFVAEEVLPAALERARRAFPHLRFTDDPDGRATLGCSSGGIAALTMAWFRPDLFRRVAAFSPSAVNLQVAGEPAAIVAFPRGAWDFHDGLRLIQTTRPRKPLRVLINDNEHDLYSAGLCTQPGLNESAAFSRHCVPPELYCTPKDRGSLGFDFFDGNHSWTLGGNRTAAALRSAGYAYRHVYALGQKHCAMSNDVDANLWTDALADALVWVWGGWHEPTPTPPKGR